MSRASRSFGRSQVVVGRRRCSTTCTAADVRGNGWDHHHGSGCRGWDLDSRQEGSGRCCCSTDIKAGHAVAVPWIARNFQGGRCAPSLSPVGHVAGTAGDSEGEGGGARVGGCWGTWGDPSGRRLVGPCTSKLWGRGCTLHSLGRCRLCGGARRRGKGCGGRRRHLPVSACPQQREEERIDGMRRSTVDGSVSAAVAAVLVRQHSC